VPFDIVIAGGGFGGLDAARRLERRLPRHSARITVVSDLNFLLGTPLLPGAASGTLEPRLFGRASAELGQLGHPPSLGTYLHEAAQPGEAPGPRPGDA
jgi:hypothetical protein